jgi:hypothetical protein
MTPDPYGVACRNAKLIDDDVLARAMAEPPSLSRWAADEGILRLTFLRLDERPVALWYDFEETARSPISGPAMTLHFQRSQQGGCSSLRWFGAL